MSDDDQETQPTATTCDLRRAQNDWGYSAVWIVADPRLPATPPGPALQAPDQRISPVGQGT
jgi:hypothetical protein